MSSLIRRILGSVLALVGVAVLVFGIVTFVVPPFENQGSLPMLPILIVAVGFALLFSGLIVIVRTTTPKPISLFKDVG